MKLKCPLISNHRVYTIDEVLFFCFIVKRESMPVAKQTGIIKIKGTIGDICFYKMDGNHYARKKSTLSSKRVKTSPAFRNTMKYARLLAKAAVIASEAYRRVPKERKERKIYQQITGKAMKMLKKGMNGKEVTQKLKSFAVNMQ